MMSTVFNWNYMLRGIGLFSLTLLLSAQPTWAVRKFSTACKKQTAITAMPNYSSLVVNANTGEVMHQFRAHDKRYPASLTKMMTLYLTFDALKYQRLSMQQVLPVSPLASRQKPSNLQLKIGETITVQEAINGLIMRSANDAAVVLAEAIAGGTNKFAAIMNAKARQLGMKKTRFVNSNGWHHPNQVTTAHDMAILALALRRDHGNYYHLFATPSFTFRGQEIKTHNRVMLQYPWADGLKTGYVSASGFNLVTSTKHPAANLVAVVMGGPSAMARDEHMIELLDRTYNKIYRVASNSNKSGLLQPLNKKTRVAMKQ